MNGRMCHGALGCLHSGSNRWILSPLARHWQRWRSYLVWHAENLGKRKGMQAVCRSFWRKGRPATYEPRQKRTTPSPPALGLQPGELVEVKPIEEILATLDGNRRCRGLLWMNGMRRHCGQQYRVYRRVQRIMLENTGETRNMKDTVLLEGVMCDGRDFGGCDRSCFHFWREAWLKRVVS